jgi:hypothetical protein
VYLVILGHVRAALLTVPFRSFDYLNTDVFFYRPLKMIDYYGVIFGHLVPAEEVGPEVLQININEMETTDGPFAGGPAYANKHLLLPVDPAHYAERKVLAVPRCCQKRKDSQDRERINWSVAERDSEARRRLRHNSQYAGGTKSEPQQI